MLLFGRPLYNPLNLILLFNVFVFILQNFQNHILIVQFALIPELFLIGKYWQIFTYGFLHDASGFPFHLLVNMYAFYILGIEIIEKIGKLKFVILYFLSQLGGGFLVLFFAFGNALFFAPIETAFVSLQIPTIGSSGAVFGLLAVFGFLKPNENIFLLFFPVKARNAVWIALLVGYILEFFFEIPLSNSCHLGGAFTGTVFYYALVSIESRKKEILNKKQKAKGIVSFDDLVEKRRLFNLLILEKLSKNSSLDSKIECLADFQVKDANICSADSYYPNDKFCLQCEWLVNCEMRKVKEIKKEVFEVK